jgi:hypothetical protein
MPEDIRGLAECPFPKHWQPIVCLLEAQTPALDAGGLRETLQRKGVVRLVGSLTDMALRLDSASSALGQDIRASMEAHLATGSPFDTYKYVQHL